MNKVIDSSSKLIKIALNTLIFGYPLRTALGVLSGVVISILSKLFYPILAKIQYLSFDKISEWHYILIGIFIIHLPTYLFMIRNRPKFDENIEKLFDVIRESKHQGVPDWRLNKM